MTVEEVRGSLDLTDNGAIRNSIRNCLTVFQNDPVLQGAVRYNILTERIDIVKPLWWSKPTATLNDTDLNYLMLYLEDKYTLTSEKKIQKAISIVADCNKYHPIRDYLNSLEWDGTERIRYALPRFLGVEDSEYSYECLRLFMLGAINRVFKPGCKFEVMLCLVGGQGAGKSTFFRLLAVKDEWFSDDLKRIDDDNVYRKMQGHWIIEMSEMIVTANAKSIEDKYRKEYNKMLLEKATGANSIVQDKYVTVSVSKKNIEEARNYFARVGADLIAHFSRLGSRCVELEAEEKLRIFHDFYRTGEETAFRFDISQTMRKGHDFKDFICPDTFEFENDCFRMGDRYGRVIFLSSACRVRANPLRQRKK